MTDERWPGGPWPRRVQVIAKLPDYMDDYVDNYAEETGKDARFSKEDETIAREMGIRL